MYHLLPLLISTREYTFVNVTVGKHLSSPRSHPTAGEGLVQENQWDGKKVIDMEKKTYVFARLQKG